MEVGKGKGKDPGEKGKKGKQGETGKGEADRSRSPRRTARPPAHPPACRGCRFFQEALSLPPVCGVCEELLDYIADLRGARRQGLTREDWETQIEILQEARRHLPHRDLLRHWPNLPNSSSPSPASSGQFI